LTVISLRRSTVRHAWRSRGNVDVLQDIDTVPIIRTIFYKLTPPSVPSDGTRFMKSI